MTMIHVPRPAKKAMNPARPISGLLAAQVQHLQHAERRLPPAYRSKIYTHAIRTEGEAAHYIYEVTEAIHRAHRDAERQRAKSAGRAKNKKGRNRAKPKKGRPS